ncbi:hypothetical protein Tco_0599454 [Tanacetum coccineum]
MFSVWRFDCFPLSKGDDTFGLVLRPLVWMSPYGLFGLQEFLSYSFSSPYQLVHVKFGVSSWRGSRVDGRSYLLSGAIDGSEVNEIIQNPKWELESSCFTFDLVPLVVRSVCIAW